MKPLLLTSLLLSVTFPLCAQEQEYVGYTEPFHDIKISSAEPGVIQEVRVKEGQRVKKGDVLVKLDARVLEQEALIAREELRLKTRRLQKLKELLAGKHASEDEVERAISDTTISELKLNRTEAQIERLTLRSPIDGIVTELRFDEAESVPGANSHVATVVQINPFRVQFNLAAAEARTLKPNDRIPLLFTEDNTTREGIVEFISPVATPVVNTLRVKVIVPDESEKLSAGARCVYLPKLPAAATGASAVTQITP